MIQNALIIIKPDGVSKGLMGAVFNKFAKANLELVGLKIVKAEVEEAEKHYHHLRDKPYFQETVRYLVGEFHKKKELIVIVYHGKDAIKKCRKIAGATNPEKAHPESIRGAYGRITTKGLYENVVHVSSDLREAEREVKLWFRPDDLTKHLYPTRTKIFNQVKIKVWI